MAAAASGATGVMGRVEQSLAIDLLLRIELERQPSFAGAEGQLDGRQHGFRATEDWREDGSLLPRVHLFAHARDPCSQSSTGKSIFLTVCRYSVERPARRVRVRELGRLRGGERELRNRA